MKQYYFKRRDCISALDHEGIDDNHCNIYDGTCRSARRLGDSIRQMRAHFTQRMATNARTVPFSDVESYVVKHVVPEALEELRANVDRYGEGVVLAIEKCFQTKSFTRKLFFLSQELIALAGLRDAAGIDVSSAWENVFEELVFFLSCWPASERENTPSLKIDRDYRRVRARQYRDLKHWPFCELCWRLSEGAVIDRQLTGKLLTDRFCAIHASKTGTAYERDYRKKSRFLLAYSAVQEEAGKNSNYRALIESLAICESSRPTHDYEQTRQKMRKVAHELASVRPESIRKVVELAYLRAQIRCEFGRVPTVSELGKNLSVTKQEISRRLQLGGVVNQLCYNEDLNWWPFGTAKSTELKNELHVTQGFERRVTIGPIAFDVLHGREGPNLQIPTYEEVERLGYSIETALSSDDALESMDLPEGYG